MKHLSAFEEKRIKKTVFVAKDLKTLREHRGLSLKGLAESVGVTPQFISMVERGQRYANEEFVKKTSKALRLNQETSVKRR